MQQNEFNTILWNIGIYLNQATFQFAPENVRSKWSEANKRNGWEEARTKLDMEKVGNGGFMEVAQDILTTVKNANHPKEQYQHMMRERVKQWLLQGDLIAFAFENPRKMDSIPFIIDVQHWQGSIDWDSNSLTSQGLEFIQIRLTTKRKVELEKFSTEYAALLHEELVRPAGRPSVGPAIEAAFAALHKAGEIDVTASQMSHFPKVRKWLEVNYPDLSVPAQNIADKTLRKYFSIYFNALNKSP